MARSEQIYKVLNKSTLKSSHVKVSSEYLYGLMTIFNRAVKRACVKELKKSLFINKNLFSKVELSERRVRGTFNIV